MTNEMLQTRYPSWHISKPMNPPLGVSSISCRPSTLAQREPLPHQSTKAPMLVLSPSAKISTLPPVKLRTQPVIPSDLALSRAEAR